jgi:murein endopeptidase
MLTSLSPTLISTLALLVAAPAPTATGAHTETHPPRHRVRWQDSVARGLPEAGSLVRGVRLPAHGHGYFTWDPVLKRQPDRRWRRWATDDMIRTVLGVIRSYHRAHPKAPRVGVGDLSLPRGGYFGPEVGGGIGHATHQNGLNVDVYYPRLDRRERPPERVDQIDLDLAHDLVDRFVRAGAVRIFVGPNTPLDGPPGIVQPLVNHDNHLHVLIAG